MLKVSTTNLEKMLRSVDSRRCGQARGMVHAGARARARSGSYGAAPAVACGWQCGGMREARAPVGRERRRVGRGGCGMVEEGHTEPPSSLAHKVEEGHEVD